MPMACFIDARSQLREKNPVLPIEKILFFVHNTLLSNFCTIFCQVVAYERLKTKENLKPHSSVVAVTYERFKIY